MEKRGKEGGKGVGSRVERREGELGGKEGGRAGWQRRMEKNG